MIDASQHQVGLLGTKAVVCHLQTIHRSARTGIYLTKIFFAGILWSVIDTSYLTLFQGKRGGGTKSSGESGTGTLGGTDNDVTDIANEVYEAFHALRMIAVIVGY
jgi:hypothetical protein